ncbi:uncharacterized protein LOC134241746 [Saccostrea cucullata]|uniref:uncharacterized protein LOC134241746 n=1 Tax=Saccostrea cuccullata TaxID=36930 RepID=UPI002ECFCFE2
MAEGKPNIRYSQITQTLDKMFNELTTVTPLENKQQIHGLWMSLYKENLIPMGPSTITNSLDALCSIKKNMVKNVKARSTIMTWLYVVRRQYIQHFIFQENKNGLQVLIGYKPEDGIFDDGPAREWLGKLSLEILDGWRSDTARQQRGPNSLFIALHTALQRQIEKVERKTLDKTLTSWESLKETLKISIANAKNTKILREFSKTMEWKDMTINEPAAFSWLPFYIMFTADAFSVNVNVLYYPSEEEVIFYPTKPTERAIRIGLINKQHFVCIIPKDEEKKHVEKVKSLELSIKDLKTRIQIKNNQINELKEKDKENKKEISRLAAERGKLEKELEEKEKEKADLIKQAAEEMETTCQKLTEQLTAKFVQEFASKIAGFTEK